MAQDDWKELLSVECLVTGIAFYSGSKQLQSLSRVSLVREETNKFDCNAIAVYLGDEQLGYIERNVAKFLAPVFDCFQPHIRMIG